MKKQSLNGKWTLDIPGSAFPETEATVPGSVYHDLLSAGLIPDPIYRHNEGEALKIMEYDFIYSRSFAVEKDLLASDKVLLRCHGLDTLAVIEINGQEAGRADNMHRTWEYDVKALLREGENTIRVTLLSPTRFVREAYERNPIEGSDAVLLLFRRRGLQSSSSSSSSSKATALPALISKSSCAIAPTFACRSPGASSGASAEGSPPRSA